jgi:predicted DNA-binding transcriptional regulator AlpA
MGRSAIETMTRRASPVAAPPSEDRYINREQLRALIPASDMTLWRWQRNPKVAFPSPVKLGDDGRNYWWLPTVRAWMRAREERQCAVR